MRKVIAALCLMAMFTGCASMIHGTSENLSVNSLEKGTTIFIDGTPRGYDSAMAQVKKGKPHEIRVAKQGCQDVSIMSSERFDATSLLGILIDFGILTIPIDMMAGGAWKVEPNTYTVTPICTEQPNKS
ncbi:MAG: hypothetical protein HZA20_06300 [Nitrospirae bacterium]|nr:hypothetical protein [Nitrospirota bacterium]